MKEKTKIVLKANTNIPEIMERIDEIKQNLEEASTMIEELASDGILVDFEVER